MVSSYCKSAGTLIAIAANEIAFGDLGELGPLDVQVMKHDEFGAQASGLDIIEAMEAISNHMRKSFAQNLVDIRFGTKISTRLAGDLAAQLTASIAAPLYAQIDPQRVAEMQRAMSIALNYGERLVRKSQSLKKDALQKLVSSYPTHSFVIDEDEAKDLFNKVSHWTPPEEIFYNNFCGVLAHQRKLQEAHLLSRTTNGCNKMTVPKLLSTKTTQKSSKTMDLSKLLKRLQKRQIPEDVLSLAELNLPATQQEQLPKLRDLIQK